MRRAKEFVDDLRLRLSRLDVKLEIDDAVLLTILNAARKKTQTLTLALHPERYGRIMNIPLADFTLIPEDVVTNFTHGEDINVWWYELPTDFIDAHVVILRFKVDGDIEELGGTYDNVIFNFEARRFDKKELFGVQEQSWNRPTYVTPVYAIERNIVSVTAGASANTGNDHYLLISGLDTATGTIMDFMESGEIEIWYTAMVPELELYPNPLGTISDLELAISIEFEELTMLTAMIGCLQKIRASQELIGELRSELGEWEAIVSETYTVAKQKENSLLPSRDPVP